MKTKVDDIERNIYDLKNKDEYEIKINKGVNEEIVRQISEIKKEPEWMLELRLKALEQYEKIELPTWGPSLEDLDLNNISTYVKPKSKMNTNWDDVPKDIKDTFDKLRNTRGRKKIFSRSRSTIRFRSNIS